VNADAIVIGAGVIGAATTFELARRGRSVICVDARASVGSGSTSSSAAIIRFHYSTWDGVLTAWESAAVWDRLAEHLGVVDDSGMVRFVPTGCLVLDTPGGNRATVVPLLVRAGIDVEELSASDIRRRFPAIDAGDYWPPKRLDDPAFADDPNGELGGYFTPQAGFIDDPMQAAHNFMVAARHHGAELRLNSEVVEIRRGAGRVLGITLASGERIDAPVVVNVGGPASALVNRLAGVTADMRVGHRPLRQEMYATPAPDDFALGAGGTMVSDANLGTYFRPHLGGTLLMGGTEPACDELHWVDDPNDYDEHPTVEQFETNTLRVARRLPSLGIPHRPSGLAALYDASDDWVPIYDRSNLDGYYMACATSGNQFKNAPMAAIFVAELIEAAERGVDHDVDPVRVVGRRTGMSIDVGSFSRRRERASTTGTVMG
jgi:sarcosine oxidase, subunit beta